jgi:hypothetical protein
VVEADPEAGTGEVAVGFPLRLAGAEEVGGSASGPGEGDGDDGHEEAELAGADEAGVLDVEASRVLASPNMDSMAQRRR